jgi:hypothetical protein
MGHVRRLAIFSLLIGVIGCSHNGDDSSPSQRAPADPGLGDPRETLESSTHMNVTVDLPQELITSLRPSSNKSESLHWGLTSQALAAPVSGARILVAMLGTNGVVTKLLGPEDGLVVNDNGNGTYTVTMPGDPSVDGMVVADPSGGSQIQQGFALPDGTFYAPASGGDVDISPESTVATRVALNYLDDFNGISSEELSSLVDTLTRIATGISSQMGAMNMGQLEADLTAATVDYLANAVAQAKQDLLFDASGYVGDYVSLSVLQSMHTSATGSYVDIRSGYQQRALSVTIPLPATADVALDLSKLNFSYDADVVSPGDGALDSHLIQTSGMTRRALSFATEPLNLSGLPVNYDGAIVVSVPEQSRSFTSNAADEVHLYPLNGYFYGSDQTIGGMFMSARREVFDAIADGAQIETEIAIRRSSNFDIGNLTGAYGALISTTSVGGPLTRIRGVQLYNATRGAFTSSAQFNRTTITQRANSTIDSATAAGSFGSVVAAAGVDADGALSATVGGLTYQGASSSDGRLVHIATADPAGTAGFATFVKLAASTSLADVSSKRYALFGALDGFSYGFAKTAAVSGYLGLSDSTTIQYLDDAEAAEFSGLAVDHTPSALRSHSAYINTQSLFNIAVNPNGSIAFNYADHQVQGFVQAGGDLLILHDVKAAGTSGTYTYEVEDRYYYAICFTGCTTTPDPALFTVGGEVQTLVGSVVLRLNNSELVTVSSNGAFAFVTPQTYGTTYSVDIVTQPAAQSCLVVDGAGTVTGNVGSVSVVCSDLYSIGGTVSGLSGTLVLQNGTETLNLTANGAFTFANRLNEAAASYAVTIATQPANQICTLTNGTGTATANVTNIAVSCASQYAISGAVSGLTAGSVSIAQGGETLTLSANGAFNFVNRVASGATYAVSVTSSPAGQTCTLTNGAGTIAAANVTNVQVSCAATTYSVGGNVAGLSGSAQLQINGGATVAVAANGAFAFPSALATGATYTVTVSTQPSAQTCTVSNGTGTMAAANVTNVQVNCAASTYTVGGTVTGLVGSVQLQNNGGEIVTVSASGAFTFPTRLATTAAYSVLVSTQPAAQTCTITGGSGSIASANVSNVAVACL